MYYSHKQTIRPIKEVKYDESILKVGIGNNWGGCDRWHLLLGLQEVQKP
jgi:hypothetical protein